MLSERDRELVCLAVDGELTPGAAREFRALVAHSAEAHALHSALASQARRLAALPRHPAPPALLDAVLAGVAGPALFGAPIVVAPAPLIPLSPRRARRSLVGPVAVAAGVLVAAGVGLFSLPQPPKPEVAVTHPRPKAEGFNPSPRVASPPHELAVAPPTPRAEPVPPPLVLAEAAPPPRAVSEPVAVEGGVVFAPRPAFVTLTPHSPLLMPVADLDSPEVAARIRDFGGREAIVRADLFSPDPPATLDSLLAVLKSVGATPFGPADLLDKGRKSQGGWVFYSESLTADDRGKLLQALAKRARDAKSSGRIHLFAATFPDARDFRELTGVERGFWNRPHAATAPATSTADQVAESLRKRYKSALVLPLAPGTRPFAVLGAEAKAFWLKAEAAPAGAVLIVCR